MAFIIPIIILLLIASILTLLYFPKVRLSKGIKLLLTTMLSSLMAYILSLRGLDRGFDTPYYLDVYDRILSFQDVWVVYNSEYAFWILNYILKSISSNHEFYIFSIAFISLFILYKAAFNIGDRYSNDAISLMIITGFLASANFYLLQTNGLRQSIAYSVFLYSVTFFDKHKNRSRLIFFVAFWFHHSALLLWLAVELISKIKNTGFILLCSVLVGFFLPFILTGLANLTGWTVLVNIFMASSEAGNETMLLIKVLVACVFIATVLIFYKNQLQSDPFLKLMLNLYIVITGCSVIFRNLIDVAERIIVYGSYLEVIFLVLFPFAVHKDGAFFCYIKNRELTVSIELLIRMIFIALIFLTYFLYVFTNPSIVYTLGKILS